MTFGDASGLDGLLVILSPDLPVSKPPPASSSEGLVFNAPLVRLLVVS